MFYIFESEWGALCAESYAAYLENVDNFFPEMWRGEPFGNSFPHLRFSIPEAKTVTLLDNYVSGSGFQLYSEKLISLLREAGVVFEAFPAELVDRKSGEVLSQQYFVFHLLKDMHADVFDKKVSVYSVSPGKTPRIKKLVLSQEFAHTNKPMARDKELRALIVIHKAVQAKLDGSGITGCLYTPVEEFHHP